MTVWTSHLVRVECSDGKTDGGVRISKFLIFGRFCDVNDPENDPN